MDDSEKLIEMREFFNMRSPTYDEFHTNAIDGGVESKNILASFLPDNTRTLLDLGVGTGLELTEIFRRFPEIEVTGLDISEKMLELCRARCEGKRLTLINQSYLDFPFDEHQFDAVISVMTLHHYNRRVKTELYKKIRSGIRPGGVYLEGDYVITARGEKGRRIEAFYFSELKRMREQQGLDEALEYHYDTPCTVDNQLLMLKAAGFSKIEIMREYNNNLIVRAQN